MNKENILPKGFYYLSDEESINHQMILADFINESSNIFTDAVIFPPVSFTETFQKGANITGEKTYQFKDKHNRDLILTPDSQAHAFNYYLSNNTNNKNKKYTWISPIFRYRNIPKRHYYQLGFASVNHQIQNEITDLYLSIRKLLKFVNKYSKKRITVNVFNPALTVNLLEKLLGTQKLANEYFEKIRKLRSDQIVSLIEKDFPDSENSHILKRIFLKDMNTTEGLLPLTHIEQVSKSLSFLNLINKIENIDVKLELEHLYCSEILNGVGFTIHIEKDKIGDGGIYNQYGEKYNAQIFSTISVCVGSGFYKHIEKRPNKPILNIFVKDYESNFEATDSLIEALSSSLKIRVYSHYENNKKYLSNNDWVIYLDEFLNKSYTGRIFNKTLNYSEKFKEINFIEIINILKGNLTKLLNV